MNCDSCPYKDDLIFCKKEKNMRKRKALVLGCTGQDGSYLAELLIAKGYEVWGMVRRLSTPNHQNIQHLDGQLNLIYGDMIDWRSLCEVIEKVNPDEVYNLAAQSSPGESFKQPFNTMAVVGLGAHYLFEACKMYGHKGIRIYQASSSEMFGQVTEIPQSELTRLNPANPYAVAKTYAHHMAHLYRKQGMFISCGILFNHESERRGLQFVTQKVAYGAACAKLKIKNSPHLSENGQPIMKNGKLEMGNLDAERDWGYSPDYVEAMWLMLQDTQPDDFVIATGQERSIHELLDTAFSYVGLNFKDYVVINPDFIRPVETGPLVGDNGKARAVLNWKPKTAFNQMIAKMVDYNLMKLK